LSYRVITINMIRPIMNFHLIIPIHNRNWSVHIFDSFWRPHVLSHFFLPTIISMRESYFLVLSANFLCPFLRFFTQLISLSNQTNSTHLSHLTEQLKSLFELTVRFKLRCPTWCKSLSSFTRANASLRNSLGVSI